MPQKTFIQKYVRLRRCGRAVALCLRWQLHRFVVPFAKKMTPDQSQANRMWVQAEESLAQNDSPQANKCSLRSDCPLIKTRLEELCSSFKLIAQMPFPRLQGKYPRAYWLTGLSQFLSDHAEIQIWIHRQQNSTVWNLMKHNHHRESRKYTVLSNC